MGIRYSRIDIRQYVFLLMNMIIIIFVVTLWIIGGIVAVCVVILVLLIVFMQKHRSNTRKRLENSLLAQHRKMENPNSTV